MTDHGPFNVSIDKYGNVSWDTGDCEVQHYIDLREAIARLTELADEAEKRAIEKVWLKQ